jgi:hypothetical protein
MYLDARGNVTQKPNKTIPLPIGYTFIVKDCQDRSRAPGD